MAGFFLNQNILVSNKNQYGAKLCLLYSSTRHMLPVKRTTMKILSVIILMLMFFLSDLVSAKKPFIVNGYYISKSGDTIHGFLRNKDSMYLLVRTENGKKKKFTPSKIKGFYLAGQAYIPLHLKEFNTNRFMAVRVKGYCSLYAYVHVDKYSMNGMGGMVGAAVEGSFKAHNSGLYIKKEDDENYYSVPASKKLLEKFLFTHFGDYPDLFSNLDSKERLDHLEKMIVDYNIRVRYQQQLNE